VYTTAKVTASRQNGNICMFMQFTAASLQAMLAPTADSLTDALQHCCFLASTTRQYLNETQVWAGLVVEVVKQLEGRLSWPQRRLLALRFHWRKNKLALVLRLVFPMFAVLAVLATLMAYGIVKINEHGGDAAEKATVRKDVAS
jgi:hypothetical protein